MRQFELNIIQGYFGMNFDDFKGIQHSDGYGLPNSVRYALFTDHNQVLLENCSSICLCYHSSIDVRNSSL